MRMIKLLRLMPVLPAAWLKALSLSAESSAIASNYQTAGQYSRKLLQSLGYRLECSSETDLSGLKGVFLVCNHQGTLDPALITASCPSPLHFVSKKENESLPLLGRWAQRIGTIHFDRSSRAGNITMIRQVVRLLKKQENILLFPEGTRSRGDAMNPFKEHALQPALLAKADILPVSISFAYDLDGASQPHSLLKIHYSRPISHAVYSTWTEQQLYDQIWQTINAHVDKDV